MDNLLKEACGMFRDPTRNVGHSWTSGRRVSLLHLSLKEEERNRPCQVPAELQPLLSTITWPCFTLVEPKGDKEAQAMRSLAGSCLQFIAQGNRDCLRQGRKE